MNEFRTVVEAFRSDLKRMHEGLDHRLGRVEKDIHSIKEQIGLLHEGQTAIRAEFKGEFLKMDKRMVRVEGKVA